jgi:nitroimidazol reductase NimA-like FMN-containing flavoprotein (pyridoxamine 5'-phosphate oxidase superfamily)
MHESTDELAALQRLLDDSHAHGGAHLQSIFTPDQRLDAAQLCALLVGVQILNLATVTAAGRPRVAPVDGLFFRGHFYFGSSPDSVRMRHLRVRPYVSAAHTRGEELAVIVHGSAQPIDVATPDQTRFRQYLLDTYVPRYGPDWEQWVESNGVYARIDADRMYSFVNREAPIASPDTEPPASAG